MERTKLITDNHVLYCQSSLIDHLLDWGSLYENIYNEDILEWWLVTPWLARQLETHDQTVIEQYGCYWWGRTCSGQAIYMDSVIVEIAAGFD